jgi:hypothetical protein
LILVKVSWTETARSCPNSLTCRAISWIGTDVTEINASLAGLIRVFKELNRTRAKWWKLLSFSGTYQTVVYLLIAGRASAMTIYDRNF